jgi:hypothetical protein
MPALLLISFGKFTARMVDWRVIWLLSLQCYPQGILNDLGHFPVQNQYHAESIMSSWSKKHPILDHFFSHMGRLSCCFLVWGIWLDNLPDLNLILCTAYVATRYFAEHTEYLISCNYGDDDAVWAGRGPEMVWQLAWQQGAVCTCISGDWEPAKLLFCCASFVFGMRCARACG